MILQATIRKLRRLCALHDQTANEHRVRGSARTDEHRRLVQEDRAALRDAERRLAELRKAER